MADKCLSFDGIDDYIYNASLSIDGLSAFSLEFWLKVNDNSTQQRITFRSNQFTMWLAEGGATGCISTETYGLSDEWEKWTAGIQTDTWHYIAFTYDGSYKRLYVDGSLVGSPVACTGSFSTGIYSWVFSVSSYTFDGLLEEVRMSSIARSSSEISEAWNNGSGKKLEVDQDTIALWHFDEGSGGTAYDETSNNYDLTISGATWADGFPFPGVTEKTSSEAGQGTEADALLSSACAVSETGTGVESLGSRLLAANEAGEGTETQLAQKDLLTGADSGSGIDTAILTKDFWSTDGGLGTNVTADWLASIIAAELMAGSDRLKVKVESPVKGGDMKLPPGGKTSIPARRVNL